MSLITQCPACSTMFRVVPDQLRLSEGWVRCGQCDEVFDAIAQLRTLEEAQSLPSGDPESVGLPDPEPVDMPTPQRMEVQLALPAPTLLPEAQRYSPVLLAQPYDGDPIGSPLPAGDASEISLEGDEAAAHATSLGLPQLDLAHSLQDASPEPEPEPMLDPEPMPVLPAVADNAPADGWSLQHEQGATALRHSEAIDQAVDEPLAEELPLSFLAKRATAPWGSQGLGKAILWVLCTLMVLLLGLQLLLSDRDRIYATAPLLRPLLNTSCSMLGCKIGLPKQIDAIAIDSSSFASVKPGVYLLKVTLKSGAAIDLATPALELTLTDAQDHSLLRRVIFATEFNGDLPIAAGAEWVASLPVTVQAGVAAQKIAGYKLLAFYP